MAQEKIPFGNLQSSGLDELAGASPVAMNVITEPSGAVRRRPGLSLFHDDPVNAQGISGLYETVSGDVFAVAGTVPTRNIYLVDETSTRNLSVDPGTDLLGTLRPVFAETESILVIAGGDNPQKVLLSGVNPSSRLEGSPPKGSHIIANASRLMTNNVKPGDDFPSTNQANFSAASLGSSFAGFEYWSTVIGDLGAGGFITAEARPDPIVALAENTNEVFCFGTTSLQVFAPDPTTVYASIPGAQEVGCSAPYSIVKTDQTFAWLDHLRRFVMSDGRTFNVLSDPIQRTLNEMTTVSDCYGYRVFTGPLDILIWTFPSDGRTFTYQKATGWGEWSGFDPISNNWAPFPITAKTDLKATSQVLVGTGTGLLGTMAFGVPTDFGSPINSYVVTGFLNHGTDNHKRVKSVTFAIRRGATTGTGEPVGLLSWRDDLGPWEPGIPISLGSTAQYESIVKIYSLGVYRRRQWRFEFTGTEDLVLAGATEDFDVLGD